MLGVGQGPAREGQADVLITITIIIAAAGIYCILAPHQTLSVD